MMSKRNHKKIVSFILMFAMLFTNILGIDLAMAVDKSSEVSYKILTEDIKPGGELQFELNNLNLNGVTSIQYSKLDNISLKTSIRTIKFDKKNNSTILKYTLPEDIKEGDHTIGGGYTYKQYILQSRPMEKRKDELLDIVFTVPYTTEDTVAPKITLKGEEKVIVTIGDNYEDGGADAEDDRDKNVNITVTYSKDGQPVKKIDTNIAGTYIVHYNAQDSAGNKAVEVTRTVIVGEFDFQSDLKSGDAPLTVSFNALNNEKVSTYAWDFNNDGIIDSTEANPKYVFDKPGKYTVKLIVNGEASITKTDYITVNKNKERETEDGWLQFQNNNSNIYNTGITSDKTPISSKDGLEELWKKKLGGGIASTPLIVGDSIYAITSGGRVYRLDKQTGDIIWGPKVSGGGYGLGSLAYGNGKIFAPTDRAIVALDADNGETLWEAEILSGQSNTPIAFKDGLIYTGSWASSNSAYVCLNENGELVWKYSGSGFYWAGAAIIKDSIIFGDESGNIISLNRFSGKEIQKIKVADGAIRSSINYNEENGKIYFTTKDGKIISMKINNDGSFDNENKVVGNLGGQSTSTPVVYNGRVYVGIGGMSGGSGFLVLNADNLERIYMANAGMVQSSPIVSTAYATKENNNTVYIYFTSNSPFGPVFCLKDFEGNTKQSKVFEYIPSAPEFCLAGVSAYDGVLYFGNDSGHIFAVKPKDIEEKKDFTITRVGEEELKLGEDAKVQINVQNNKGKNQDCTLIVALYNKDTKEMINYGYVTRTVRAGETEDMVVGFSIPKQGNYEVKAMVWDEFDTMNALSNYIKLEVK